MLIVLEIYDVLLTHPTTPHSGLLHLSSSLHAIHAAAIGHMNIHICRRWAFSEMTDALVFCFVFRLLYNQHYVLSSSDNVYCTQSKCVGSLH